jgi:hypothetical protein
VIGINFFTVKIISKVFCDTGQHCVSVLFGVLCPLIGRSRNFPCFPINRWRRPKFVRFRSCSKCVRFVHSSLLPLQKRMRLRKSELDKKTMLFLETTSRGGTQPAVSRVTPAWKRHGSTNRHRLRQFDRSRGPMVTIDGSTNSVRLLQFLFVEEKYDKMNNYCRNHIVLF